MRKIEVVNFEVFQDNDRLPKLSPPELAAYFARFSRNREGIQAIYDTVKDLPRNKRVDAILKFNDYGHRSIMDMLVIPVVLEGISMYAAARLFNFANQAAGQESSTRYIAKDFDILPSSQTCTTTKEYMELWGSFDKWKLAVAKTPPNATREQRNEILDSVRYLLPAITTTNVAIVMSSRAWEKVLTQMLSYPHEIQYGECLDIVTDIKAAITRTCGDYPMKHVCKNGAWEKKFENRTKSLDEIYKRYLRNEEVVAWPNDNLFIDPDSFVDFERKNRYDPWPDEMDTIVTNVAMVLTFAELRDLNRHRNRLLTSWTFLDTTEPVTLGSKCILHWTCSISQILYEIEIRTSEGAHPSYRRLMNLLLEDFRNEPMLKVVWPLIERNLFANSGIKDN